MTLDAALDAGVDAAVPDAGQPVTTEQVWQVLPTSGEPPLPRGVYRATVIDSGRTLLVGGQSVGRTAFGDAWILERGRWRTLGVNPLAARKSHGQVWDSERQRLVIFGGMRGGLTAPPVMLGDTVEWDGSSWTAITPAAPPSARAGHAMAFDEIRNEVVVFGGTDNRVALGDTHVFSAGQWTERHPQHQPPARFNAQMAFDSRRGRVLLFGGHQADSTDLNDLWAWDGTDWTEVAVLGSRPAGRGFFAMAYDEGRDRLVIHGGTTEWPPFITAENTFADAWEFDGERFVQIDATLPKRSGHALVSSQDGLVLLGGVSDGEAFSSEPMVLGACTNAASACNAGQLLMCNEGRWTVTECTNGCEVSGGGARCIANSSCQGSFVGLGYPARINDVLMTDVRTSMPATATTGQIDYLQVRHPAGLTARTPVTPYSATAPIRVVAALGEKYFVADEGFVEVVVRGSSPDEPYHAVLSELVFVEASQDSSGLTRVQGGETFCLSHALIGGSVFPPACTDVISDFTPGMTSCFMNAGHSFVLRCLEGELTGPQGRNLGRVEVAQSCSSTCEAMPPRCL